MVWGGPASLKVDMAMIRRTREPGEHGFTEIDELELDETSYTTLLAQVVLSHV